MASRGHYPKRSKQWRSLGANSTNMTASATTLMGTLAFTDAQTVLRMIGGWQVGPSGTAAFVAGDSAEIVVGIGIVSSDAAGVGSAAMPDPLTDEPFPWLYWKHTTLWFPTTATDPNVPTASKCFDFDIRSMRKVKPRESLVFVAQYFDVAGAPDLQFQQFGTRVLVALA